MRPAHAAFPTPRGCLCFELTGPLLSCQALCDSRSFAISAGAIRSFPTCILNGKLSFDAHASDMGDRPAKRHCRRHRARSCPAS
jgi:hypothetical protein